MLFKVNIYQFNKIINTKIYWLILTWSKNLKQTFKLPSEF